MKQGRMNLFRQLNGGGSRKIRMPSPKSVGVPLAIALTVAGGEGLYLRGRTKAHNADVKRLQASLTETQTQLAQVVAMSEEVAARRPAAQADAPVRRPSGMDGSLASVLWKFAAFSGTQIRISEMNLGGGEVLTVTVTGSAASLKEVRSWVERLIENMPGSEFSLRSGRVTGDADYPVSFNVSVQVI